jgi:hypothetical protein
MAVVHWIGRPPYNYFIIKPELLIVMFLGLNLKSSMPYPQIDCASE